MALLAISQEFQIKRYDSFTRQLSGWGFRRLDKGKAYVRKTFEINPRRPSLLSLVLTGSYYHQCFLRGIPEITCLIRRIPSGGGRMSREGKPPDFDAISREFPVGGATLAEEVPSDSNIVNLDSTPSITRPSDANIVLDSIPSITRAGEVREAALRHETSYGISNGRELPSSGHSMGNAWPALWSILAEEPQVLSSILAEDPQVLSGVLAEDPQVLSGVLAEEPQVLSSIQQLDPHNNMQQHQACRLPTHRLGLGHTSPQYQDVMHSGLPGVPMPDELADQQLELQDMQQHQAQGPPIHQLGLRSTSPQYQDTVMHSGLPGIPMPGELANDLLLYYQNLDYQGTNEGGF